MGKRCTIFKCVSTYASEAVGHFNVKYCIFRAKRRISDTIHSLTTNILRDADRALVGAGRNCSSATANAITKFRGLILLSPICINSKVISRHCALCQRLSKINIGKPTAKGVASSSCPTIRINVLLILKCANSLFGSAAVGNHGNVIRISSVIIINYHAAIGSNCLCNSRGRGKSFIVLNAGRYRRIRRTS